MWPYNVSEKDLRIEAMRGSGDGGQKKQKTSSKIRITHKLTGISAESQDSRMQSQNKKIAFKRLADKLVPLMLEEIKKNDLDKSVKNQETVRHYRQSDRKVKDKRISKEFDYQSVLFSNGLDEIITELVKLV